MTIAILWPTFVLVALIYGVVIVMFVKRIGHIRRNPPTAADFADGASAARYFRPVEMPANNMRNLFEMPVLYFALVPLLMLTHHAGHIEVTLAWIYVGLRIVHSLIHIGPNPVMARFITFMASCIVLSVMWIGFAIDMASVPAV